MLKFKVFLTAITAVFSLSIAQGQIYDPVDWSFDVELTGKSQAKLIFKATIEKGWHIYALNLPSDQGPLPTVFTFNPSDDYTLAGKTREGEFITHFDPNFNMDLNYFEDEAVFTQTINRLSQKDFKVAGELSFMVCNDEMCLPPDYLDFELKVAGAESDLKESINEDSDPFSAGSSLSMGVESESDEILDPVEWTISLENETDTTAMLVARAKIAEHWHVYDAFERFEVAGPEPTEFVFDTIQGFEPVEEIISGEPIVEYDPNFEMELAYFEGEAIFKQKIRKLTKEKAEIVGYLSYMACDDSKCIFPPPVEFSFELKPGSVERQAAVIQTDTKAEEKKSLWAIFGLALAGGLAALLTPCVFPMIPMTVSFFTKQSKNKSEGLQKGFLYGFSIIFIYVLLSLPFHIFDSVSPDVFNEFSTNPYLNIFFFLVFIVFAISFLGAFEITMPNSWVNKADRASEKGGSIGIFFMALTLILVSFSCTGPAIGLLLGSVLSSDGGAMALTVGMAGFGLGLGLPFGLFAMFPGWLNSLPKSGGWLNVVKVSFGFLELAFAFKFLSNADLVTQFGLLQRELFIAIWVGVFLAWALYMFGLFRLPHDSPIDKISVGRSIIATFLLVFVIYLLPGMWGAPLKLISGFPPPMFYSESPEGVGGGQNVPISVASNSSVDSAEIIPEGADPEHCPLGLNCFHEFEQGLNYAIENKKPILLDFTGWACVNCRKMEEQVWSDPRVLSILKDDVVLISLYVDERKELPENLQYTSGVTKKKIRTVGNKWSEFQIKHFRSNTQPYYVMIGHNSLEPLNGSASYDPDVELYRDWLLEGIAKFDKVSSKK